MKDTTIQDPLYLHIQKEINLAENKSDLYRNCFYFFRVTQILLGAAVTLIAAIVTGPKVPLLIIGIALSIISAVETLFEVEVKKSTYKLILFELREIRTEIIYMLMGRADKILTKEEITSLYEKYKSVRIAAKGLIDAEKNNNGVSTSTSPDA